MSDRIHSRQDDASAPQADGMISFSWSGFCKPDIMRQYASVLAHICEKQRARETKTLRSGNTSRRILWRNSLLYPRSWCPSSRPPAHGRLPSRPSNRSLRRSMSSPHRPKANTTNWFSGQGPRSAPTLGPDNTSAWRAASGLFFACFENFLWSAYPASASLLTRRRVQRRASARYRQGLPVRASVEPANRSFSCQRSPSCLPSVQPLPSRPVPVRPPNPSLSWRNRSWLSPSQAKASIAETRVGLVSRPDAREATAAPRSEGRPC